MLVKNTLPLLGYITSGCTLPPHAGMPFRTALHIFCGWR
jgi:hypothetical protein